MMKILTIICSVLVFYCFSSAQEMTATEIVNKIHDSWNQDQSYAVMNMTFTTSSGKIRTLKYESWSKDRGEKNLIKYLAPSRVKGQAILMLNNADDIWVYFPRTGRVRKLATHAKKQKMEGSDFSYEDMGSGDTWLKDFTHQRLPDEKYQGKSCYKIEITPKEDVDSGYSKIVMLVDKQKYLVLKADYYEENYPDLIAKTFVCEEIKTIQGVPTPLKMVMRSHNENSETVLEILRIDYEVNLTDDMFTERGMRK